MAMARDLNSDDVVLPPGEVIDGKYEIRSKIGQGGMGVVYKAWDLALKRDAAIKMLTHVDNETLQRFRREAHALASIKHRAVIRIDAFGDSPLGPYLVVEYVAGRDLGSLVKLPLPIEEAVDLALAICSGVSACHDAKLVHRDLKPSNIRVRNVTRWSERVKILDFGLAIPFDSPILKAHQTRITNLGAVPGTARYIAPELLRHEEPTPYCDQYGIASLLYLMLTGRAPFDGLEGDDLLQAIANGDYVAIRMLRSGLPPELQAAIQTGLALDPSQRFPTVNHFALQIVPHATPSLKTSYTRYFSNAQHVDRRLVEPVSAFRRASPSPVPAPMVGPSSPPTPPIPLPQNILPIRTAVPKIVTHLHDPTPREFSPDGGVVAPSPSPRVTPPALPHPAAAMQTMGKTHKSASHYNPLFIFIGGTILGACITLGAFLCFFSYLHAAGFCAAPSSPAAIHAGDGSR